MEKKVQKVWMWIWDGILFVDWMGIFEWPDAEKWVKNYNLAHYGDLVKDLQWNIKKLFSAKMLDAMEQ